ncbi:MAG: (d)CMP kinase [Acidobacteria bacterium]|nr:MAG: (d)CMP kinase [Acidobacteriota bacterium]
MVRVIAMDGPSGSGKSTVAKIVAEKLGWFYLNTGAMYRAVGLFLADRNIPCDENAVTGNILKQADVDFDPDGHIVLNGNDISDRILTPEAARHASDYSKLPAVRKLMTALQRKIGLSRPSVVEGRDIGTVVFPDADHKFFIVASPKERARRRFLQLKEKDPGTAITIEEILKQQNERDSQDQKRALAPLKQAEDAILVDTTEKTIDEVVEEILARL